MLIKLKSPVIVELQDWSLSISAFTITTITVAATTPTVNTNTIGIQPTILDSVLTKHVGV